MKYYKELFKDIQDEDAISTNYLARKKSKVIKVKPCDKCGVKVKQPVKYCGPCSYDIQEDRRRRAGRRS